LAWSALGSMSGGLNVWLLVNELWGCVNLVIGGIGGVGGFEPSSLKNLGIGGIGDGSEWALCDFKYVQHALSIFLDSHPLSKIYVM
jgi:hypothetical protein